MDAFSLVRPLLFALDPEQAHTVTLRALRLGLARGYRGRASNRLALKLFGLDFPNPVGLAAGFDKDAAVACPMLGLGLGFVEAGTVTPRPQPGNPRPRLFRLRHDRAVINRLGFNGKGHAQFDRNYARQKASCNGVIGVNVGANRDSADPIADYVAGIARFSRAADYLVVNISSPNTPGLRDLQSREHFTDLLGRIDAARRCEARRPPLLVKIAPDLSEAELAAIVEIALEKNIDGLIVSNTTIDRPASLRSLNASETGGLSGKPLFEPSTEVLRKVYRLTEGRLPLVGVGGIASGDDAYAKIKAGASLVQLYTALIYGGPALVGAIVSRLDTLAGRDGLSSINEAIGVEAR